MKDFKHRGADEDVSGDRVRKPVEADTGNRDEKFDRARRCISETAKAKANDPKASHNGQQFPSDSLETVGPTGRNQKSSAAIPAAEHQHQRILVQQNRPAEPQ